MESLGNPPDAGSPTILATGHAYYSIAQATALLGVSRVSIWRWIRDGRLPAARLGHRTTRIAHTDLERILTQRGLPSSRSGAGQNPDSVPAVEDGTVWERGQDMRRAEVERRQLFAAEQQARAEAEAALRRLRAVQIVSDAALAHLSIHDLLQELLGRLTEVLGVDNAAILIPTDEGRQLLLYMARGPEEQIAGQIRVPVGQGIAGTIAARRQPLIVDDLSAAEVANPFLKQTIRSLMGIPLMVQDRLLGVLHAGTAAPRHFTEDDLLLLRLVGDRVGLALEHARLFEEEQQLRAEAAARAVELEAIFEAIADGVVVFDNAGEVLRGNSAGRDLLNMQPSPMSDARLLGERGQRDAHDIPRFPPDWPLFRVLHGEVLKGERAVDLKVRTSTGREREISVSGAPMRDQ
ncbi:MAG TPA: GAF domain-containing protein, partial [Chloroflexota bacterium]|nr:GAF domain-containing protein [Chloroflexota bacterium]